VPIVLQNSQNAVLPISRKQTKQAEIAERHSLQAVTEVACELWQNNVVPQMIIRSPNVRPGEFAIGDAKRLLQHNLPEAAIEPDLRLALAKPRFRCYDPRNPARGHSCQS
jgi:hypothetical protein